METVTDSQELVVWAEKSALTEAKDTFSRFDASFRTIPSASSRKDIPTCKVSLFYLRDAEPNAEFESILKAFKGHKTSFVVLYTPHHSSDFAFRMGKIVGKHSLDSADGPSIFAMWNSFSVPEMSSLIAPTRRRSGSISSLLASGLA
jgi:hypothetical protein